MNFDGKVSELKHWLSDGYLRLRSFSFNKTKKTLHVHRDGFYVVPDFLSDCECGVLRETIDKLLLDPEVNVWRSDDGADSRIFFTEQISERFDALFMNPLVRRELYLYTGIRNPVGFVMANRIDYCEQNVGSGHGWHRDSPFAHQFKAIVYLSDVSAKNGPFQYLKKSHLAGAVIEQSKKMELPSSQHRFDDVCIDKAQKSGAEIGEFEGKKGTMILVDTKGIHRGKPLIDGSRYALTCYFFDQNIPAHFDSLRQK